MVPKDTTGQLKEQHLLKCQELHEKWTQNFWTERSQGTRIKRSPKVTWHGLLEAWKVKAAVTEGGSR